MIWTQCNIENHPTVVEVIILEVHLLESAKFLQIYAQTTFQTECGEYLGIFHGILSVPHNNVMDLNNVMT